MKKRVVLIVVCCLILIGSTAYAISQFGGTWKKITELDYFDGYNQNSGVFTKLSDNGDKTFYTVKDNLKVEELAAEQQRLDTGSNTYNVSLFLDGKNLIGIEVNDYSAIVVTNDINSRFILEGDGGKDLYDIDPETYKIQSITKNDALGYVVADYEKVAKERDEWLVWALNPEISPKGDCILYWSNKCLTNDVPDLLSGIWLYSYEDNTEDQLISGDVDEYIGSSMYWIDDSNFVYFTFTNESESAYIYLLKDNQSQKLISFGLGTSIEYKNGFLVYKDSEGNLDLYDIKKEYLYEDVIKDVHSVSTVEISKNNILAYPLQMDSKILVIDLDKDIESTYELPNKVDTFILKGWLNKDTIIVQMVRDIGTGIEETYFLDITE